MSAILRTGERFGMEHLIAILLGERTDNVLKFNHDRLPTFGVGSGRKAAEWRSIYRQLSAIGLIAQDLMEHGRWWVTDEGWRVLKGEASIELRKDLSSGAAGKGSRRDKRVATAAAIVGDADAALLEALKALRTRLAQAHKVPAYVVFSDRTLVELATHRPTTPRAMKSWRARQANPWRRLPQVIRSGAPASKCRHDPRPGAVAATARPEERLR
jgi:ATP-dependent DNA helicase RecQ